MIFLCRFTHCLARWLLVGGDRCPHVSTSKKNSLTNLGCIDRTSVRCGTSFLSSLLLLPSPSYSFTLRANWLPNWQISYPLAGRVSDRVTDGRLPTWQTSFNSSITLQVQRHMYIVVKHHKGIAC